MRWVKKLEAVCVNLFFCIRLCALPSPSYFCCHFNAPTPQRHSHQWFLLFVVNIPNVSLFIHCIFAVTKRYLLRLCKLKHATVGSHNTHHNAQLEGDVEPQTFILLCLSLSSHKGFYFKLYKVNNNNSNIILIMMIIQCLQHQHFGVERVNSFSFSKSWCTFFTWKKWKT